VSDESVMLRGLLKGRVSIICHHNADPDAIGAAYAMQRLILLLDPDAITEILYPDTASILSKRMIARYSIEASKSSKIRGVETVLVVDVGSLMQVKVFSNLIKGAETRIFLDHHGNDPEIDCLATLYISNNEAVSTCEMVYDIWESLRQEPPLDVAETLLIGIIFDSKHLSIGTSRTFRVVAKLLELGASLSNVHEILQAVMDQSERIARLKSVQRARLYRVGVWLVAGANLGSFQASAARGMISLGADLAIIVGSDKKKLKASIRSSEEFNKRTGIHIGDDLSKQLAKQFSGGGGGHPTAAGVNGVGDAEAFLEKAVGYIVEKIGSPAKIL
jgi:phosphoesterase RecJ-like protein